MTTSTPNIPLRKRLFVVAVLFMFALGCVLMLGWPLLAITGIKERTTTTFEVEVDNDKVPEFKAAAKSVGADVEKK